MIKSYKDPNRSKSQTLWLNWQYLTENHALSYLLRYVNCLLHETSEKSLGFVFFSLIGSSASSHNNVS